MFSQISQVTSNIIEAIVSITRLSSFFAEDELQQDARKLIEKPLLRIGDEVFRFFDKDVGLG
jgi:ATP-binding cassette subfamily C (CFTR/MRP) protein 1